MDVFRLFVLIRCFDGSVLYNWIVHLRWAFWWVWFILGILQACSCSWSVMEINGVCLFVVSPLVGALMSYNGKFD